jgi:hypothetical protein
MTAETVTSSGPLVATLSQQVPMERRALLDELVAKGVRLTLQRRAVRPVTRVRG